MVDGFNADIGIARRGEEFKLMVLHGRIIALDGKHS
jgi:hypothetical protein